MRKVHGGPVDRRGELRPLVQLRLGPAPVVTVPPVVREFLQVRQRNAVGPAHTGQLIRPPGAVQARGQIVEVTLWDIETEREDAIIGHGHSLPSSFGIQLGRQHRAHPG